MYSVVFTLHVSDATGVIVLARSVCVYACVSYSWVNGQTYRSEFWHGGQVEECVKVIGQGHLIFSAMK